MHDQIAAEVPAANLFAIDRGGDAVAQDAAVADVLDDQGALPTGALCVLADHALGAGVAEALQPEERMVTSHLHIELIRPLLPGLTHVVGACSFVERVPGSAFAPGVARDPDGELLARISARFAILDGDRAHGGPVTPIAFLGPTSAVTTGRLHRGDGKLAVQVDAVHTITPPA